MSDLVEFLRARLDEDEQTARVIVEGDHWHGIHVNTATEVAVHIERHDPARVLREVEAGRLLVDQYERLVHAQRAHDAAVAELDADIEHEERTGQWAGAGDPGTRQHALRREADYLDGVRPVLEGLVKALAAVHADHPDYREEWRPA